MQVSPHEWAIFLEYLIILYLNSGYNELVVFWIDDSLTEATVLWHLFIVLVATFGTGPVLFCLILTIFIAILDPFYGAVQVERLKTLTTVPHFILFKDTTVADWTLSLSLLEFINQV